MHTPSLSADRKKRPARAEQARTRATKAAIIDAALGEFARLGFDGATTRGIAERAGVNASLIGHHFGSKDALWKAVADDLFRMYRERLNALREGLSGVDHAIVIRLLLREFLLMCADVPDFHRFMMQANSADNARLSWLVDRFLKPGSKLEVNIIGQAQAEGILLPGDPMHIRFLFLTAATSIFTFAPEFQQLSGKDPQDPDVIDQHIELVLSVFAPRTDTDAQDTKSV